MSLTLMLFTEKLPLQRQNILSLPSALKCCSWISHHLIFLGHEIKECLVLQSLSIHLIASPAAEHYADHLIVTALILYWWQKHSPEDDCLRKNIRDHNVLGIMKDLCTSLEVCEFVQVEELTQPGPHQSDGCTDQQRQLKQYYWKCK